LESVSDLLKIYCDRPEIRAVASYDTALGVIGDVTDIIIVLSPVGYDMVTGPGAGDYEVLTESRAGNPFMFQGARYEPTLGLYDFHARMYDPISGEFTTRDPYEYLDNFSEYVAFNNNPLVYHDPDGELVICGSLAAIAIYTAWQVGFTIAETAVEYAAARYMEDEISIGSTLLKNFGVNMATGWIGGNFAKAGKAGTGRRLAWPSPSSVPRTATAARIDASSSSWTPRRAWPSGPSRARSSRGRSPG